MSTAGRTTGSRLRLLVITSSFPRHHHDLAGHFVGHWCRALASRGHGVDVLAWRGPSAVDRRTAAGVKVDFVPYAWPSVEQLFFGAGTLENIEGRPLNALLAVPAAAAMLTAALRACRRQRYDVIVGHWLVPGGLIARVVADLCGVPCAVVGHSGGVHLLSSLPRVLAGALRSYLLRSPVTVPTDALRDKLVGEPAHGASAAAITVAPMGFEPFCEGEGGGDAVERDMTAGIDAGTLKLGFLGRLVPIKGLPTVLEALHALGEQGQGISLEVVGAGPCRKLWEAQAPPHVRFLGPLFGAPKWACLRRWDALVLPSTPLQDGRHEGLPVSLLEAASAGAIPLVSGVPGIRPWLARPSHQILSAGDVSAWRLAIEWLAGLDDGERHHLTSATKQAVTPLAWPDYIAQWEQWLYRGAQSETNHSTGSMGTPRCRNSKKSLGPSRLPV